MNKIANISHDNIFSYTGTAMPVDYKFVCWVGDSNEKQLLENEEFNSRDVIQVTINDV